MSKKKKSPSSTYDRVYAQARDVYTHAHQWTVYAMSLMEQIPHAAIALFMRLSIAPVFWFAGRAKVHDGLMLNQATIYQFKEDFGFPFPTFFAQVTVLAEHVLPILLILGLATRFAALGIFMMTIVIQLVFPDGWWQHHALWFAAALYLMARGPGFISLDHVIKEKGWLNLK